MQYRPTIFACLCVCLAAGCVEGPVTITVPPLDGPLVTVTGAAGGSAPPSSKAPAPAHGSSVPRAAATVAPDTLIADEVVEAVEAVEADAGVADVVDAGDDIVDAGAAGSSAPMGGAGGAGGAAGSSAPIGGAGGDVDAGAAGSTAVAVPDYPATRCQLADRIVDCRPDTLHWHPDWYLSWTVGHAIPDGWTGVTYSCQQGSPACVKGAECAFAILGSGTPVESTHFGVCL